MDYFQGTEYVFSGIPKAGMKVLFEVLLLIHS